MNQNAPRYGIPLEFAMQIWNMKTKILDMQHNENSLVMYLATFTQ